MKSHPATERVCRLIPAVAGAVLMMASAARGQDTRDSRLQYPAWLADSYVAVSIGAVDYPFSGRQLRPGLTAGSVDTPHVAVRVALFGHEFTRHLSVQGSYMRPVNYVSYVGLNGDPAGEHHHVRVNFGNVTARVRLPIARRYSMYGEGGIAFTSRTGFTFAGAPAVTDGHFATPIAGGGIEYRVTSNWDLTGGVTYTPGKAEISQPRTLFTSGGFRYTMRQLTPAQLAAASDARVVFPRQVVQLEYSSGLGHGVNELFSQRIPIFWGGRARVAAGVAPHYERNVFHTRRVFSLDFGVSAGAYRTRDQANRFYTASVYPLFRWTFLRTRSADLYFAYSAAGPTVISKIVLDEYDTGRHFTFQDFMGVGFFAGANRHFNAGIKINHFSNGNIFIKNAGVAVPLTFSAGFAF